MSYIDTNNEDSSNIRNYESKDFVNNITNLRNLVIKHVCTMLDITTKYQILDVQELVSQVNNENDLDFQTFKKWFADSNIAFKTNPYFYFKKVFPIALRDGDFKKVKERQILNCSSLFQALRENGVEVDSYDCISIEIYLQALLDSGEMTLSDVAELNHKLVNYLGNQGKTTKDFITSLKRCKSVRKVNLDWENLDKQANSIKENIK